MYWKNCWIRKKDYIWATALDFKKGQFRTKNVFDIRENTAESKVCRVTQSGKRA